MSVSIATNQDYCLSDEQQDRSDGSVVGSERKLKPTVSKTSSNETYLTNVDPEEGDEVRELNQAIINSNSTNLTQLGSRQSNISHPSCSSSSSSSTSSILPSRVSSGRHSTESIIAEQHISSIILPRLQIPHPPPNKPVPKKSASFSCMKTVPQSNFYLNHHHFQNTHPNSHPHLLVHHPNRVPSRELKKGCSRITRSKSNLSLVKKSPLRHESFEFPRFNLLSHSHHHHHHGDGQVLLPGVVRHQHSQVGRKDIPLSSNQYPLCVTCLRTSRESSSSFKLRKDFILEMQEERMRIQDLINRRKIRKQQKSNEKLALIAILLINVAFFISFCFLGMMFLRSVRLPTSS